MSTSIQSCNGMTVETRGKRVFINGQEVVDCKCGKAKAKASYSGLIWSFACGVVTTIALGVIILSL